MTKTPRTYIASASAHAVYSNINFMGAIDYSFILGSAFTLNTKEIPYHKSDKGNADRVVVRMIFGSFDVGAPGECTPSELKCSFFKFKSLITDKGLTEQEKLLKEHAEADEKIEQVDTTDMKSKPAWYDWTSVKKEEDSTPINVKITPQDRFMKSDIFDLIEKAALPLDETHFDDKAYTIKDYTTSKGFEDQVVSLSESIEKERKDPYEQFDGCMTIGEDGDTPSEKPESPDGDETKTEEESDSEEGSESKPEDEDENENESDASAADTSADTSDTPEGDDKPETEKEKETETETDNKQTGGKRRRRKTQRKRKKNKRSRSKKRVKKHSKTKKRRRHKSRKR